MTRKERFYRRHHKIIFPKIKEKFKYKRKTPHEEKVSNSNYTDFLPHLFHPFANLSIGKVAGTPPLNPFSFCRFAPLC